MQEILLILQLVKSTRRSPKQIQYLQERANLLKCLSEITKCGRQIRHVKAGSIIFSIMCPTLEALDVLYALYTSGKLKRMFIDAYITDICPDGTTLSVTIDESAWNRRRAQLLSVGE